MPRIKPYIDVFISLKQGLALFRPFIPAIHTVAPSYVIGPLYIENHPEKKTKLFSCVLIYILVKHPSDYDSTQSEEKSEVCIKARRYTWSCR